MYSKIIVALFLLCGLAVLAEEADKKSSYQIPVVDDGSTEPEDFCTDDCVPDINDEPICGSDGKVYFSRCSFRCEQSIDSNLGEFPMVFCRSNPDPYDTR